MFLSIKKYAFINSKLRAKLSKILNDDFYDQLINSYSLTDAMTLLKETEYSFVNDIYNNTNDLKLVELELFKNEINLYRDILKYINNKKIYDFILSLIMKYEIDNLKNALRLWFDKIIRKRNIDDSIGYIYREKIYYDIRIDEILNSLSIDEIIDILKKTPYQQVIKENKESLDTKKSLFEIEVALDKLYYTELLNKSSLLPQNDYNISRILIGIEIDLININWIIRFKSLYSKNVSDSIKYTIPNGYNVKDYKIIKAYDEQNIFDTLKALIPKKYQDFSIFLKPSADDMQNKAYIIDKMLQHILLSEIRKILGGYPFTIGIILAYFILKRNEIKTLITILNAKYYKIPPDRIKSLI